MSLTTPDAIGIGTAALGGLESAFNYIGQQKANREQRDFSREMYDKQRKDALADWTMQNEYNSPTSQMARLREAGLNPNLVYGKGADNTAAAVRSSSSGGYSPTAPKLDIQQKSMMAIAQYQNFQQNKAQIDNLKAQNTVLTQEALLKEAQRKNLDSQVGFRSWDLSNRQNLAPYQMNLLQENIRKTSTETTLMNDKNVREIAKTSQNIQESAERILNYRKQRLVMDSKIATDQKQRDLIDAQIRDIDQYIESVKRDVTLKDLEINLKRMGVTWQDPIYYRVVGQLIDKGVTAVDNPGYAPAANALGATGVGGLMDIWKDLVGWEKSPEEKAKPRKRIKEGKAFSPAIRTFHQRNFKAED